MKHLLTVVLLTVGLSVSAGTKLIPDMKFRRLDTQNGLSSSQVNCVYQDSRGFVWLGTPYGLNRYDGYRFRTYYSNIRDTTSMRDNYTDEIYEAYDGKLWLKQNMNYCVYDPETERFERNPQRILAKFGIDGGVERLFIDSKKNFWVKLYDDGIYYYNPTSKRLHLFKRGYEKNELNPTYGLSNMAEYGDQVYFTSNCGELVCLNGEKGIIEWDDKWMRENGGPENQRYEIKIDPEGNIWVVTSGGTFIHNKKENRWYNGAVAYLTQHGITEGLPEELDVWGVLFDHRGWTWMVTDHEGVFVMDMKSHQLKQFKNNKYNESTISDNTPRNVCQVADGTVWIGTYKNGVNQYVEGSESFRSIDLGDINTVCEDKHGNYWVGTNDKGILVYDPRTGEVVRNYTAENSGLSGNVMVGSYCASDGSIWFGSYNGGLVRCIPSAGDPTQATIVNYRTETSQLANNNVWSVTEDKWHRIWFATLGGGLQMLDLKTGQFRTWDSKTAKVPSDYMSSVGWTKKGWLLVGTSYYYALVNPVSMQFLNQLIPEDPNITVVTSNTSCVTEDSRGLIWQGSDSGVSVYDPRTKHVTLLDMTKGLIGSGVNSSTEDRRKTMWVVTDHGISNVVPQKQNDGTWQFLVRSFNSGDGLQKAIYNQRSTCLTHDGLILVGGQGGLDIIDPSKLSDTDSKERPVFAGLELYDMEVRPGEEVNGRVILDEAMNYTTHLDMRFNDQFTIELATNMVKIGNFKRFAYKLEGFNENWVKTTAQNPTITYNSLRAGSYKLCVRILNDDGTLGSEEATLDITIHPPLWRTRWMILLYMLIIALAAWLWRKRFLKQQEERMQLERLRRETEKKHWMSEMMRQMQGQQSQGEPSEVPAEQATAAVDGEKQLVMEPLDLVALIREECDQFVAPKGKNIRLSFFPFVDDLTVRGISLQLREVIQILLANASTFSPAGSKVKVYVERQGQEAVVRVADTGIGIPGEVMPHLFEEIIGDDDSPNLHTVFDIVMGHGGTVNAEPNHGAGTVFTIKLPLEDGEVEEAVMVEE